MKITVADFAPANTCVLDFMLTDRGHKVQKVHMGRVCDFMEQIKQQEPDVVIFEPRQFLEEHRSKGEPAFAEVMRDLQELDSRVIILTELNADEFSADIDFPVFHKPVETDVLVGIIGMAQ